MTRKEQHKARKRKSEGAYLESFGHWYLYQPIKIDFYLFHCKVYFVEIEED
jgi:hypothetical protein